jgi:DNA recombination protein RmuC
MDALLMLVIGLVSGGAIGALAAVLLVRRRFAADQTTALAEDPAVVLAHHQTELADVRAHEASVRGEIAAELASVTATAQALREQIAILQQQSRDEAERRRADDAAREARERAEQEERRRREREEHEKQLRQEEEDGKILQALAPVRDTLQSMQNKVSELEKQRSEQYGSLAEQLKLAQVSDEQLRATTESLASALRSNSTRGVWGETQLRRVVEAAGLTQYVDFTVQTTVHTDAGAGRPDMVIQLPGRKSIAVDSKVPLEHYIEASQIAVTATGEEGARRKQLIDRHVKAVRAHVDALAKKTYWEGLEASPEFVIAFIPSESLLSSALEADPTLLDYAFGKRVALASPVNLWAVLKTVAFTWQQQAVTDEAKKLFDLGNTLYQRVGTLSGHAESLRKALQRTVTSYNNFANSLESRVLVTARQFPGIDATKIALVQQPDVIHESPRRLTALELTEFEGSAAEDGAGEETAVHVIAGEDPASVRQNGSDDESIEAELDWLEPSAQR